MHADSWIEELPALKAHIFEKIKLLGDAASIAQGIESMECWEYDLEHSDEGSLEGFLGEVYFHSTPGGVAKRRTRNDEIEREIEEDERDLHLARLGYTFTFDRPSFWKEASGIPPELHKSLIRFGLSHEMSNTCPPLQYQDFERLFYDDPRAANAWQDLYNDDSDTDDLVCLLRMLRLIFESKS